MRFKHEVERRGLGEISRAAARALDTLPANHFCDVPAYRCSRFAWKFQLVSAQASLTIAAVNQGIAKRVFVARILPNQSIQDDRRIDALDIIAFVDHPAPPGLFH